MEEIKIQDYHFEIYLKEEAIQSRIKELSKEIDISDNSHFLVVGEGANVFFYELIKNYPSPTTTFTTVQIRSYSGTEKLENHEIIGDLASCKGKEIIIVEDVVDTGGTVNFLKNQLKKLGIESITIVTLLFKPHAIQYDIPIQHVGFEISNEFVVGYGLDLNGEGRTLRHLYQLKK